MELVRERYPQIDLYMQRQHFKSLVDLMNTATASGKQDHIELSLEQFKAALSKVDTQMKHLPATAQVCYHAHILSKFSGPGRRRGVRESYFNWNLW